MNTPPSILVVDDDETLRTVVCRTLQAAGYHTVEAGDGRQGYDQIRRQPVDLVITDIIMPEVEGLELILRLQCDFPQLPILAISGGGRISPEDYLQSARYCGAARVLSKPFERLDLLAEVAALLNGRGRREIEAATEPAIRSQVA